MRLAVLDLGTSSFHLIVADVAADGERTTIDDGKELVRLGAPALGSGLIEPEAWRRGLGALEVLVPRARRLGPDRLVAVATSAIREASNGGEFVAAVRAAHGIDVRIISGDEEARLSYAGARAVAGSVADPVAMLDVGGGSVELAVGRGDTCLLTDSLPLGVLRLRERLCPPDGVLGLEHVRAVADEVRRVASAAAEQARALMPQTVLLVGGTPRRLARIAQGRDGSGILSREALTRLVLFLIGRPTSDLAAFEIEPARRDTIAPGGAILASLMTLLGAEWARVVRGGLREGVLLEIAAAGAPAGARRLGRQSSASALVNR